MTFSQSSSEYDDAFNVDYSTPSKRVHMKVKEEASPHVIGVTTILSAMLETLEKVEKKVDERLSLLEESCFAIRVTAERDRKSVV